MSKMGRLRSTVSRKLTKLGSPNPCGYRRGQVGGLARDQEGAVERPRRRAVDLVEGVEQAELLDRRRHPRRDDAAHPAALDHQRDAPPVGPRAGLGALVAAAADELDHRVAALVLGHRRRGAMRVEGEALQDCRSHRLRGYPYRPWRSSVRPRSTSAASAWGWRRWAAPPTSTSGTPATWPVTRTSRRCGPARTRSSTRRLPRACATSTRPGPMGSPRTSWVRGWPSGASRRRG